jgi:predicted Zn-dependent peptidase
MKKITFQQLNETLYHEKMDNGLEVYILPKEGFNKTFATFTTKYGSVDNHFVPLNKKEAVIVPDGIAHFLEHKLFEKEDGDVFQQFSQQGAAANAFTSFTRTAYLFSSTSHVEQNLETLMDFVQEPFFSKETVEKEKGIIGQEITMYDDNPDWRLYFGTIENMYHNHPVKIDIAGTIESIHEITKDDLYLCYETFYHPSNMLLFVVGNLNPDEVMKQIKSNQDAKEFAPEQEIERHFKDEPDTVAKKERVIHMPVQTPKCMVGMKDLPVKLENKERLKRELVIQLMFDMLFGRSSKGYRDLYDQGLIDDSFSYDFTQEEGFGFGLVGGDSENPNKLAEEIKKILLGAKNGQGIEASSFDRLIKKKIGLFLRSLNSPEYIANQFTRFAFLNTNLFDVVPVLETITFEDVVKEANNFIAEDRMTVCHISK